VGEIASVRDGAGGNSESARLEAFRALAADLAPRDLQDLMSYPFFSLSKSKRIRPIDYHAGDIRIRVEGTTEHGIATIWDADVLIWAASQIVEARDAGIPTSRLIMATPYEILGFVGRDTSGRAYGGLKAALDRLQSTTVATSIRQPSSRRLHRFSWINEWKERATGEGRPLGLELVVPDWFYASVIDSSLILTIDRAYFSLTGGIERWLYRLARKHAGKQPDGWRFDFRHLHVRSGSLARYSDFAIDLRRIARVGVLPGYRMAIERSRRGAEVLHVRASSTVRIERTVAQLAGRFRIGDNL
jgi:plasmid replication initiation protein